MKRIFLSLGILGILATYLLLQGMLAGACLRDMREELAKKEPDPVRLQRQWNKLRFYLEWTAIRTDLDEAEESLALFSVSGSNGREADRIRNRLDRALARIHDGYVPSFSGVF